MTRSSCVLVIGLICSSACNSSDDAVAGSSADAGKKLPDAGSPIATRTLDRSAFADVGTSGRLDYATAEHWACRPDIEPDECARNIDATEIKLDGSLEVHEHVPASDPAFDCFYVYPTVWVGMSAQMTDFSENGMKLVRDPVLAQAARFTELCRVYAPMYRQAGLAGTGLAQGADKQLALQDVRDAFAYYLAHDNHGRKFVLLGHSQGSYMLTSLISRDIDDNPKLRAQMISAVLLGAQPYAAAGERVGGSFKNVPSCAAPAETGCVIAYDSFAAEAPPSANALVSHVTTVFANEDVDTSGQVFCTEPAALARNDGALKGSYFPQSLNNPVFGTPKPIPGVDTPFTLYRGLLRGRCKQQDGLSWLEVSVEHTADDKRPVPDYRSPALEAIGFGMHLVDYGIALEDLMTAVSLQAQAAH